MSDKEIVQSSVSYRQILNQDGELVGEMPDDLDSQQLITFYRQMLLIREIDRKAIKYQRQGRLGTYAPVEGQEACQVGTAALLEEKDWVFPAFREQGVFLLRGIPLRAILMYFMGCEESNRVPEGNRTFPISVPVASQLPLAVGCAMAMRYKKEASLVATYFSDGATSEGDFNEALNFAAVFKTPVLFLCQNNQWAISVPRSKQTPSKTLAQKAIAYDMPTIQIDGNDILAVYQTMKEAVEHVREGKGPYFIEMVTYRRQMHTTADDPKKYQDPKVHEKWLLTDPIERFDRYLKREKLIDDSLAEDVSQEAAELLSKEFEAAEQAISSIPADEIFRYTYAEMPQSLKKQYEEFQQQMQSESDKQDE